VSAKGGGREPDDDEPSRCSTGRALLSSRTSGVDAGQFATCSTTISMRSAARPSISSIADDVYVPRSQPGCHSTVVVVAVGAVQRLMLSWYGSRSQQRIPWYLTRP